MLSVLLEKREGYRFYFILSDGVNRYGGGLTDGGFLTADERLPYKELMLRTLVNKSINDFAEEVKTVADWGVDLLHFGFSEKNGVYTASFETLRLPHDCGCGDSRAEKN